jgi:hypothetical protein
MGQSCTSTKPFLADVAGGKKLMSYRDETASAMSHAMTILKGMGAQSRSTSLGSMRDGVVQVFGILDALLSSLPEDTSEEVLEEVERVVTALHNADRAFSSSGDREARRLLDLATQRVKRLAQHLS